MNEDALKEKEKEIENLQNLVRSQDVMIQKLRRVEKERTCSERGINEKKHNNGYVVTSSTALWERYPSDPDYGFDAWKTVFQIPYKVSDWCWYGMAGEVQYELIVRIFPDLYDGDICDLLGKNMYEIYRKVDKEPGPMYSDQSKCGYVVCDEIFGIPWFSG